MKISTSSSHLVLLGLALFWLMPIWMMLVFATHGEAAIYNSPQPYWPGIELLDNLERLSSKFNFLRAILNSSIVASAFTALSLILSSLTGYAFARYEFVGKKLMFSMIVATLAIPLMAVVIPQYTLVAREMQLANSYVGVILPYLANSMGVLFMRQIFLGVPQELIDAARIEGASEARVFWQIVIPIVKPALAALAIMLFLIGWNDYLWPLLVLTDKDMFTAPVAMGTLMGIARINWSVIMVGVVLMSMPFIILFLFLQRHLIAGITQGAVK